jgi:hypothetical protein
LPKPAKLNIVHKIKILFLILAICLIFAQNFFMEVKRNRRGLYWLLFFISTAALILAIATHWPWLTLLLPFVTTFFVLAMDIM